MDASVATIPYGAGPLGAGRAVAGRAAWARSPLRPWNGALRELFFGALKQTGSVRAAATECAISAATARRLCAMSPEAADRAMFILGRVPGRPVGCYLGDRERRAFLDALAVGDALDMAAGAAEQVAAAAPTAAPTTTTTPAGAKRDGPVADAEPMPATLTLRRFAALRAAEPDFAAGWDAALAAAAALRRSQLAKLTADAADALIRAGKPVPEQHFGGPATPTAGAVTRADIRRVQHRIRRHTIEAAAAGQLEQPPVAAQTAGEGLGGTGQSPDADGPRGGACDTG